MQQSLKRSAQRFLSALFKPLRVVIGTYGIQVRIGTIEAELAGIQADIKRLEVNRTGTALARADVERLSVKVEDVVTEAMAGGLSDFFDRAVAKTLEARLDNVQQRTAALTATLSATLRGPIQDCVDEAVRSVVGPLVGTAVQNEMQNINLQIDRLIGLNAPLILPSLTNGTENYQSMVRAFLRRLKPKSAPGASKVAVQAGAVPSFVVLSAEPRQVALFSVSSAVQAAASTLTAGVRTPAASPTIRRKVDFGSEVNARTWSEALRRAEEENCCPILYVDLNGGELDFIERIDSELLGKFDQLVVVMYDMANLHAANFLQAASKACDKIESDFCCVHIHARNTGGLCSVQNVAIPNIVELTFANKRKFQFVDSDEVYPTPIDTQTTEELPDIYLGNFVY